MRKTPVDVRIHDVLDLLILEFLGYHIHSKPKKSAPETQKIKSKKPNWKQEEDGDGNTCFANIWVVLSSFMYHPITVLRRFLEDFDSKIVVHCTASKYYEAVLIFMRDLCDLFNMAPNKMKKSYFSNCILLVIYITINVPHNFLKRVFRTQSRIGLLWRPRPTFRQFSSVSEELDHVQRIGPSESHYDASATPSPPSLL